MIDLRDVLIVALSSLILGMAIDRARLDLSMRQVMEVAVSGAGSAEMCGEYLEARISRVEYAFAGLAQEYEAALGRGLRD
tara:strand:+ start:1693 stop:1932 length:240 start_codon:yes stop_codon:yes gene_type:complete